MAKLLKRCGIPVFIGGPHVTYMAEEALEHCDYVLRGEADATIEPFLEALFKGEGFEKIPGLSYKKDGKIFHNGDTPFCKDLNVLPPPDFSIVKGLEEDAYRKFPVTPVMTSRGCPYDCSFCSVTKMFGHKYRFRAKENVMEELRHNRDNGGQWVFFYDDNFTAHKPRTKELLKFMIEGRITPNWTAQVRVDVAKDIELVKLMKASGCHTVYIGFESINPATLEAYNKGQSVEDIEWCIRTLRRHGIRIHGMFVFGSDEDTTSTIEETARFAKKNNLDSIQFLILTPLPGTKLHRDFERDGRIVSRDWSLYDAHHVVFEPKKMSYYELQTETMNATRCFYSVPQILKRAVRFDLFNVAIKAYGYRLTKMWFKKSQYFVDYTKTLTHYGRRIELSAKKTAEDVKEKFRQLELSAPVILSKSHRP
jgi:radical SAM superfamily enzyme YgiQ (UPF0313 family)